MEKKSVYCNTNQADNKKRKQIKKKRLRGGDASSGTWLGPWAPYEGEAEYIKDTQLSEEQQAALEESENKRKKELEEKNKQPEEFVGTFTFHGEEQFDYKGRSFVMPGPGLVLADVAANYIPKKCIQTFAGHTKGVLKSTFFPKYGHFLLTSSFDTTVKIWDVYKSKKCMMTYKGHKGAVKDM